MNTLQDAIRRANAVADSVRAAQKSLDVVRDLNNRNVAHVLDEVRRQRVEFDAALSDPISSMLKTLSASRFQVEPSVIDSLKQMMDASRLEPSVMDSLKQMMDASRLEPSVMDSLKQMMDASRLEPSVMDSLTQMMDASRLEPSVMDSLTQMMDASRLEPSLAASFRKIAELGRDSSLQRVTREVSAQYETLLETIRSTGFLTEVERLNALAAPTLPAIRRAPDEPSRRKALTSAVQVFLKGWFDLDIKFDSPQKKWVFLIALLHVLYLYVAAVQSSQKEELARVRERAERQAVERQQAETMAALTNALQQLQDQIHNVAGQPLLTLRVTTETTLRESPNSSSQKHVRLYPGQRVNWLKSYRRWRWVEVLDAAGEPTGSRGWLYRATVRDDYAIKVKRPAR